MRNGTKNIMFPYEEYETHYVIGFVYTRNPKAVEGKMYRTEQIHCLTSPYKDVEVFVQEKYRIAGDKPGSGNTENIGSYKTNNLEYLINGEGPFSVLGMPIFEDYWAGYPKYRSEVKNYTSLEEYFEWCEKDGLDVSELKRAYRYWRKLHEK